MRKSVLLLLTFIAALAISFNSVAQEKARMEITSVKQKGETVRFSVTSSKPFIFGNNKYILHVGDATFSRYEQTKKNGKGTLTFLIPISGYKNLDGDAGVYLNYGETAEGQDMEALAKQSRRCWPLGKLDKNQLTK